MQITYVKILGLSFPSKWSLSLFFFLIASVSFAQVERSPAKRTILIFWDSSEYDSQDYSYSAPHEYFESVLNYFGYKAKYFDVEYDIKNNSKLDLDQVVGALSWFSDDKMNSPQEYLGILTNKILGKIPFLIFGNLGMMSEIESNKVSFDEIVTNLSKVQIEISQQYFSNPALLSVQQRADRKLIEFERPLDGELSPLWNVRLTSNSSQIWLELEHKIYKSKSVAIGFNQWVGIIQTGYGLALDEKLNRVQWRVNPFKVVETFFKKDINPVPDTTTICGKRIFWAHLDGDSFFSISELDRKSYNGEIFEKEILSKYNFPHSVSIIEAEISPQLLGNQRLLDSAKRIFQNPLVEAASHTYSHPLSWELNPSKKEIDEYLGKNKKLKNGQIIAYNFDGYRLNYEREIKGSIDYINQTLNPLRPAKLLLWSGSCMPPADALKVVNDNDLINMNGGDSRFDTLFPSYAYVSPLYRQVDKYLQVYSGNSNENIYTNFWEGPFGGFEQVIETFNKTDAPYRIRPINIYYHFYSLEKESSFKALIKAYDFIKNKEIFPIYASDYAKIIKNYLDVEYGQLTSNSFFVEKADQVKTFRFDKFQGTPDYSKSTNIVGHKIINNSLYVFLGQESKSIIVLGDQVESDKIASSCQAGGM